MGVHAFTGSGAILGFLALISILNNDQVGSFLWLGMALLVDGVDGTLARKVGVEEKAPNLDGIILDSIIDYLNYVINPALMIYWFQMVPSGFEMIIPALIFGVSLYTFINVNIDKIVITIRLIHSFVFKIKKYSNTIFQHAGNPTK